MAAEVVVPYAPPDEPRPPLILNQAAGPRVEVVEAVYDFGQIDAGQEVRHDFVLKNTGDQVLEITSVRPGCGCTTAGEWDRRIPPGATGRIPLALRSAGFSGHIAKSATITCNDPTHPSVVLQLRGTIRVPIQVTPSTLMFQYEADATAGETKVIKIVSNLDEPLVLGTPECSHAAFRTELKAVREGKEFELAVTTVPPIGNGTITAPITLTTSVSNTPSLRIVAYAVERQALLISPTQVFIPSVPLAASNTVSVMIRANTTNALTLSEPSIDVPGVALAIREVQPQRLYTLTATFPQGFDLPEGKRPLLSVKSNHARYPRIQVPVIPRVTPPRAATPVVVQPPTARVRPPSTTPIVLPPTPPSSR